jgi:hypothetical protein
MLIVTVSLSYLPYRSVFDGGFSNNSSDWGALGSYLSGTLGPAFSFLSIIAVVLVANHQINKAREQLETEIFESKSQLETQLLEQRKLEYIKSLEQRAQAILDMMLLMITERRSPHRILHKYVDKLGGPAIIVVQQRVEHYALINKNTNIEYYLDYGNIFGAYNGYSSEFGLEVAYKDLIQENTCGYLHEYQSFAASASYLLQIVKALLEEDYNLHLVRHMLSQPYDALKLLNKIGLFPDINMLLVRNIMSCPLDQSANIKIDIFGGLVKEFNRMHRTEYSQEDFEFNPQTQINPITSLYEYRFKVKPEDKDYRYSTSSGFNVG